MTTIADLAAAGPLVAPSLLAADFANLEAEIRRVESAGADMLHLDVMDGHFVPNLTIGPPLVQSLRRVSGLCFDTHLMLTNPRAFVAPFAAAGSNHITIHVECQDDIRATLADIRAKGLSCGLSVRPKTPAEALLPFLDIVDMVLVMTVEPGFGGQSFMPDMMPKVATLRKAAASIQGRRIRVQVDGGIDSATAPAAVQAGADVLVAGTAVFRAKEGAAAAIRGLKAA